MAPKVRTQNPGTGMIGLQPLDEGRHDEPRSRGVGDVVFVRYLAAERNVSPHTTAAYRDTLKCCSGLRARSRTDRSRRSGSRT
jgi:hypothetical protein